jgi:hypothetical protein
MKATIKKCIKSILVIILLIFASEMNAQISRTAYFFEHLPIANTMNPAFTPSGKWFLSLPVISSTYIGLNSPLNYNQITEKNVADDYLYIDRQTILDNMNDVNVLSLNFYSNILQVGIRAKRHSFQFGIATIWSTNLFLEKELVKFLSYGNASEEFIGRDLTFSKTGVNSTLYNEYAVGYSYDLKDLNNNITFGVKLKYLNGVANIYSENTKFEFYTADDLSYAITASSDIAVHTSSSFGNVDRLGDQNMIKNLKPFSSNHGYALDLGVTYIPVEKLKLSLSAIDLGKINWKENVKSYVSKYPGAQYTFYGLDINDFIQNNTFIDTVPLLDSIAEHFKIEEVNEPYSSYLTPKSYLGATYDITPNDQFGLLIKTDYFKYLTRFGYTVNYKRRFGKTLTANINYSFLSNKSNFGFGLALKAGPVHIFAISDMITSYFNTLNARSVYFQFGICLIFNDELN